MSDLFTLWIPRAAVMAALGWLLWVAACIAVENLLAPSAYLACDLCDDPDCEGCHPGDEFDGEAWDRARDLEQDRQWGIAS
ncbi:hypothetical protein [Nocardia farcinica]|uniref:hypothetical protein n=1 Tax=Nocardia farcinica TaxID=37329 RepID=UPI001893B944|nr:hypothetical protein [Nocardia farcinica]MBF6187604.1 hypothetical protein [Nocardia farcinica]